MGETPQTPLETALARMQAAPKDTARRLQFHAELLDTELFVLLADEATGPALRPKVFEFEAGRAVLVFDSESRLADFAGEVVPYAALPGRVLVMMLAQAGEALSLLISPDSEHAELLPPEALEWLARTLGETRTNEAMGVPEAFIPVALPESVLDLLVPALERRLRHTPGLEAVVLAGVRWRGGGTGHVLALGGAAGGMAEAARAPLAHAVAEALELSGIEAGALDVIFPDAAAMGRLKATGLALSPAPWVDPTPP
ncbi:SseB family protein, partial [Pararhodobacter sp.]|uniref:SseB family protein n=1 Tax=Pararhodobacter sp. TaxID=2127056 RepID=UPI002FDE8DA7